MAGEKEKISVDSELRNLVKSHVQKYSWFQRYGVDGIQMLALYPAMLLGLYLISLRTVPAVLIGLWLNGAYHGTIGLRASHAATHGAFTNSPIVNKVAGYFFSDFCNQFSSDAGYVAHIKGHHPYTNIIGYGDSSTFKAPYLSRYVYLFGAPFLLPFLNPIVSVKILIECSQFWSLIPYSVLLPIGIYFEFYLIVQIAAVTTPWALAIMYITRAVFAVQFLHVNAFQHIGLEFYEYENRPKSRTYQMTHSVLNFTDLWITDLVFGASICSCHIEHHLFPSLSDNMLRKIKPIVKSHLLKNNFPYYEKTYGDRLRLFIKKYNELMVEAPSILSMAGIQ